MNPTDLSSTASFSQTENQLLRLRQAYENPGGTEQKKLRQAAQDLEGVFFQQLLDAIDKTVDRENSILGGGYGEEVFKGMMNQEVAKMNSAAPGGSGFGLAEIIFQQMSLTIEAQKQGQNALESYQKQAQ